MSNLKGIKNRINGVKSTQKITKAMRMVAASKLTKIRRKLDESLIYIGKLEKTLANLTKNIDDNEQVSPLIDRIENEKTHLIIVVSPDRGLCGSLNSNVIKECHKKIEKLKIANIEYKLFVIGKKGYDSLKTKYADKIIGYKDGISRDQIDINYVQQITDKIITHHLNKEFDVCSLIFSYFKSVISQKIITKQIIPFVCDDIENDDLMFEFEPNEKNIIEQLLPKNLASQIYFAILEALASEYGARMNAMENATNNADEIIKNLTLKYNRSRQAAITNELVEIISGAEAL